MKRVLITGVDSYVGDSVEQYLARWPERYQVDKVDMRTPDWKNTNFSKYDCVFHVAGLAHADYKKVSEERKALYYRVNTQLTEEAAKKAKNEGVKQFLFMSTVNVYGASAPIGKRKVITKDSVIDIVNLNGDSKFWAEQLLHELESVEFKVVILRAPMIYGRGCKGNYATLSKLAKKLPVFPDIKNERSMLYIGNLVEFVRLMIENEEQGTFFPCDKEWYCTSEIVKLIAAENGKKIILVPGCSWLLKLLSHFSGQVNKAFGSFAYDPALGAYKQNYRKYALTGGVRLSERKGKRENY